VIEVYKDGNTNYGKPKAKARPKSKKRPR
jgi:hypothetical protein